MTCTRQSWDCSCCRTLVGSWQSTPCADKVGTRAASRTESGMLGSPCRSHDGSNHDVQLIREAAKTVAKVPSWGMH